MQKSVKVYGIFFSICLLLMLLGFLIGALGNENVGMVFIKISVVLGLICIPLAIYIRLGGKK